MAQRAGLPSLPKGLAPKQLNDKVQTKPSDYMKGGGICILEEDFESVTVPNLVTAGWDIGPQVEQQSSTGVGAGTFVNAWAIGTGAQANNGGYFPVPDIPSGNKSIYANDDGTPCNCDMVDVGLVTPSLDFTGLSAMSVGFRVFNDQLFGGGPSKLQVSVSGGPFTDVFTIPASSAWQIRVVDLSAFDGEADVRIRFSWSDGGGGNWATGMAIDDVCVAPILPNNLTLTQVFSEDVTQDNLDPVIRSFEYSFMPLSQAENLRIAVAVANNGGVAQTNVTVSAAVTLNGTPVAGSPFTSSPLANLAQGASDTIVINTPWTPSTVGTLVINATLSADATDDNPADNDGTKTFEYSGPSLAQGSNVMARDNGAAGSFFGNQNNGYKIGPLMEIMQSGSVAYGVGVAFGAAGEGLVVHGELLDANLDVVAESNDYEVQTSDYNTVGQGNFTYIPFTSPFPLNAQDEYVAALNHFGGGAVRVGSSGTPPAQTVFFFDYDDGQWYYVLGTAMVRLFLGNAVGIEDLSRNGVTLGPNMPNPFNGNTSIQYELSDARLVTFNVLDISGKVVFSADYGTKGAGKHLIDFNAAHLAPGVYSYTLTAGRDQLTRRMVVTR